MQLLLYINHYNGIKSIINKHSVYLNDVIKGLKTVTADVMVVGALVMVFRSCASIGIIFDILP